jgi:hypothetical protein
MIVMPAYEQCIYAQQKINNTTIFRIHINCFLGG